MRHVSFYFCVWLVGAASACASSPPATEPAPATTAPTSSGSTGDATQTTTNTVVASASNVGAAVATVPETVTTVATTTTDAATTTAATTTTAAATTATGTATATATTVTATAPAAAPSNARLLARGRRAFDRVCATCHEADDSDGPSPNKNWEESRMRNLVRQGGGRMRAIPVTRLSDADLDGLIAYLRSTRAVR